MKIKSAVFSVIALVVLSVSTAWAAEAPKPGKTKSESVKNMTRFVCAEVTPVVAEALAKAYEGRSKENVRQFLKNRTAADEKAGKYYLTVFDADKWVDATVPVVMGTATKVMEMYPGDKDTYAKSVKATRTTYFDACMKGYAPILEAHYDETEMKKR